MARSHAEDDIQRALVTHLTIRGARGLVFFHVPNAPRSAATGARLKKMGMRAGVSDLILVHRGKVYALELKAPGGRPTESQMAFASEINAAGGFSCVCEGLDRAIAVLECWGLLLGKVA